jgi:FAD/FMN-containing dehydrogenase
MAGAQPAPLGPVRRFYEYEVMENAALAALCRIGRRIPPLVRPFGRLSSVALSDRSYSDVSHRVFVTHRRVHFVESEYAVPRAALREVIEELRAGIPRLADPIMLPIEVRAAAADDIWLSTAYQRESAYVAIHQYVGMPFRAYFDMFEAIAGAVGGRPHWGKMHTADAATLRTRYPRFDDFARVRAEVDPEGRFTNPYIDRVLGPSAG